MPTDCRSGEDYRRVELMIVYTKGTEVPRWLGTHKAVPLLAIFRSPWLTTFAVHVRHKLDTLEGHSFFAAELWVCHLL